MNEILNAQTILVDVDYYSRSEKEKFKSYSNFAEIDSVVGGEIKIPTAELLEQYFFHRNRPGSPSNRSRSVVKKRMAEAGAFLSEYLRFNGSSLYCIDPPSHNCYVEWLGESVGISVINRIHNLTESDWTRINYERKPAPSYFDYEEASNGSLIIQVETKGSCVDDNDFKRPSVSNHKGDIVKKKVEIEVSDKYPFPADLRYGTITVADEREDGILKCFLVDPEPSGADRTPESLQLIKRVQFLRDWIAFMSPTSLIATALSTRLASLKALPNPFSLDGVPLRKATINSSSFLQSREITQISFITRA